MASQSTTIAFERVREQIGYCGIWCGGCVVGNGTLRELTSRYAGLINSFGLPEWGPENVAWKELQGGLASIETMPPCPGCLNGGGRDNCEMKSCARNRKIDECNHCSELSACPHDKILHHMRDGAIKAGIPVKTASVEKDAFLERWEPELRSKWPCCALFTKDLRPDEEIRDL
jgi:hypothetical protein